jgi:uncharacterized membrane protein YeaQ/YmgE (transglycosylase-associated protein family)
MRAELRVVEPVEALSQHFVPLEGGHSRERVPQLPLAGLGHSEHLRRVGILSWIVLGLVAGALAKLIMPCEQGGGILITIALGVVGALVGGFLVTYVFGFGDVSGFKLRSIQIAVGGALLVLFAYGLYTGRRRV